MYLYFDLKLLMKKLLLKIKEKMYRLRLFWNVMYDFKRYFKFSRYAKKRLNQDQLLAKIIAEHHVIEKGLSFKNTRPGFGQKNVKALYNDLKKYLSYGYDSKHVMFISSVNSIRNYIIFNKNNNINVEFLSDFNKEFLQFPVTKSLIEYHDYTKKSFKNYNYKDLATSRVSVRNFSEKKIPNKILVDSVSIAQKSPSVCNRQSSRVYIIKSIEMKRKFLSIHNGSRGFGFDASCFIVVCSDLSIFDSTGERNQSFIDGGIFTMSLLHSLQYNDIATCTLNWSTTRKKDIELRNALGIKESYNIIAIIACGGYMNNFSVAKSIRRKSEEIIHWI